MKQGHLRILRIVVSLIFLVLISALFVDYREMLPSSWSDKVLYLQFVPSVIRFITLPAIAATGFIVIILITLLFGRVYCSALCPLGIFQDVVAWISKKTRLIKRYKYKRPLDYLRYPFLALTLIFIMFGSLYVLNLLDPYSSFGRIFSDLVRPGIVAINNQLAGLLEKFEVYFLYRLDFSLFTWSTILIPVFTAALVIWLALYYGRLYCNTICPVGTLLGLLSRFSLFRIKMDRTSCTKCGKCSFACKANCIDIKKLQVDFSRCVACYDCIPVCDSNSIKYGPGWHKGTDTMLTDATKRRFIGQTMAYGLILSGLSKKVLAGRVQETDPGLIPNHKEHPVSPPGSISLKHFNNRCTACHLCITACPTKVLQPSFLEYGFTGMMQPHMNYAVEYCNYECTICSEVCPTGAILPLTVEDKKLTQIGKVNLILDKCVVITDDTACGSCSEHCPTQAVRMVPYKDNLTIPEIHPDTCIGCGACEFACPVKPHTAIYVDGNAIHQVAKKPEFKELEHEVQEEFPF
jgi:ferredoxin